MASRMVLLITVAMAVVVVGALLRANYKVGDEDGWKVNVDYNAWASDKYFKVDDTLELVYSLAEEPTHNVLLVDQASYEACTVPPNAKKLTFELGDDRVVLAAAGQFFLICGVEGTMLGDDEHAAATERRRPFQSVALVVGCTGIVGASLVDILRLPDTPGRPWKVYALSRRPLPPWWQQQHPPPSSSSSAVVTHLQVDLAYSAAVATSLTPLNDITHVFYSALSPPPRSTDDEAKNQQEANSAMLRSVLAAIVPSCPQLRHVCLQTRTKHYMGPPASSFGRRRTAAHDPPYTEDMPRLDWPNFYYDQEDVLLDAVAQRCGGVTWSVHRPSLVFGFSPRSAMNIVSSLCVYAAICRKEGVPLRWPGSLGAWEGFSNASDADLVAEQQVWAAVVDHTMAKNEAFYCSNGDVFRWRQLWPVLARRFRMEWAGYRGEENRVRLVDAMAGKGPVWAEIVEESQLVPTQLHEVANWSFVDALFYDKWEFLDSMNKSKSTDSSASGTPQNPSVYGPGLVFKIDKFYYVKKDSYHIKILAHHEVLNKNEIKN